MRSRPVPRPPPGPRTPSSGPSRPRPWPTRRRASPTAAAAAAAQARDEHERAVAAVVAAQKALDQFVAGAYRSGGSLALISAMLDADPLTFATGQAMIDHADAHQKGAVDALASARAAARAAADVAATAERDAAERAAQVGASADAAVAAAAQSRTAAGQAQAAAAASADAAAQRPPRSSTRSPSSRPRRPPSAARTPPRPTSPQRPRRPGARRSPCSRPRPRPRRSAQAQAQAHSPSRGGGSGGGGIPAPSGSAAQTAISWAFKEIGVPYSWGGGDASGPTYGFAQGAGTVGFDCSGLTLFAYAHAGIRLGHYTGSQWDAGRHVTRDQLLPGDLVFYATDLSDPSTIHHVGLYLGGGKMIEAPHTGDVVKVSNALRSDLIGGVRLVG